MILITNSSSWYLARGARTSYKEQWGLYCQTHGAMPTLSLNALHFQTLDIQLGQWHHHCLNAKGQPSATHYLSLTIHHPTRRCHYASLVEIRMLHNQRPMLIRTVPNTKDYFWGSEKVHGGNWIHDNSVCNFIWWLVVDVGRSFETSHWSWGSSGGIGWCYITYDICVSIGQGSITQNRSKHTRSCMSWIMINAPLSDLWYWRPCSIFTVKTTDMYHSRRVGR